MKKPRFRVTPAMVLLLPVLLFSLVLSPVLSGAAQPASAQARSSYEGPGWPTAEEAARAYLDAFSKADLAGMAGAFAIETYVEHFDFGAQLDRLMCYIPQAEIPYPNSDDFCKAMNVEKRQNNIVNSIHFQIFSLCFPDIDPTMLTSFGGKSAVDPAEFARKLGAGSASVMKDFAFLGFVDPALLSEHYLKDQNQKNLAKLTGIYGADELKSVAASISVEGKPHLFCCDAIRYGEKWYLCSLGGNIGILLGMDVYHGGLSPAP